MALFSDTFFLVLLDTFSAGRGGFLKTFSAGWVPPDAPGDAKVRLGSASNDQVCFFIDFLVILGSI